MTPELDNIEITEGNIVVAEWEEDHAAKRLEQARLKQLKDKYFKRTGQPYKPRIYKPAPPTFRIYQETMHNIQNIIDRLRTKAGDQTDAIVEDVKQHPSFHLNEGGSDGTFNHVQWHALYGHLKPEITDLAEALGGQV